MTMLIEIPKNTEMEQGISDISQRALQVRVVDDTTNAAAGEVFMMLKDMEKKITDFFKPHKDAAHKAHKQLCVAEKNEIDKIAPGIKHINQEMSAYRQEQELKRIESENRLRGEAIKREEDRLLAEAAAVEAEGDKEAAEAILTEPVYVPPIKVEAPKAPAGVQFTTRWKSEVVNLMALVQAVASGKVPIQALQADMIFLNRQAIALKDAMNYPGVRAYPETSAGSGRR